MKSRPGFAALAVLMFLIAGCAGMSPPTAPVRPIPCAPEAALARLDSRNERRQLLKAVAQAAVNTETARYPLRLAILAGKPASLRLEAIPIIGLPNFFLSVQGGRLAVYLPQQGEYYTGNATGENLARFFPVPLSVAELLALLHGCRPELPAAASPATLSGYPDGKAYRLDISSGNRELRQSLWIDPGTGNLIRFEQEESAGTRLLTAYFEAYEQVDGFPFPQRLRIKLQGPVAYGVELQYESVALEKPPAAGEALFTLPAPPGVKIIDLDK